jgi:hypothetical protein
LPRIAKNGSGNIYRNRIGLDGYKVIPVVFQQAESRPSGGFFRVRCACFLVGIFYQKSKDSLYFTIRI